MKGRKFVEGKVKLQGLLAKFGNGWICTVTGRSFCFSLIKALEFVAKKKRAQIPYGFQSPNNNNHC
jgi:hypothetical protein